MVKRTARYKREKKKENKKRDNLNLRREIQEGDQPINKIKYRQICTNQVLNLMLKLENDKEEEVSWALSSISVICCQQENALVSMIKCGLLPKLIKLLEHENQLIQFECLGTIRNLVGLQDGGVGSQLVNLKLLDALEPWIKKIEETVAKRLLDHLQEGDLDEATAVENVFQNLENLIVIMWTLAEVNQKIYVQVCRKNFMNLLEGLIMGYHLIPTSLLTTVCHCLLTLSDHNVTFFKTYFYEKWAFLQGINNLALVEPAEKDQKDWNRVKVLVVGILINFKTVISPEMEAKLLQNPGSEEVPLFYPDFGSSALNLIANALPSIPELEAKISESLQMISDPAADQDIPTDLYNPTFTIKPAKVVQLEGLIQDQSLFLEVLTNLVTEEFGNEASDDVGEDEAMEGDDEGFGEEAEAIVGRTSVQIFEPKKLGDQLKVTFEYTFEQLLPFLIQLSLPHPIDSMPTVNETSERIFFLNELKDKVSELHCTAATAATSLLLKWESSITPEELHELLGAKLQPELPTWFRSVLESVVAYAQTKSTENLHAQLGLTLSLFRTFGLHQLDHQFQVNLIELLIGMLPDPATIFKRHTKLEVRAVVETIGILSYITRRPDFVELNGKVGALLIQLIAVLPQITPELLHQLDSNAFPALEIALVALDSIFDTYNDMNHDFDCNFRDNNWLDTLRRVQPFLPALVKRIDRRRYAEVRQLAEDTVVNLKDFIAYKVGEYRN